MMPQSQDYTVGELAQAADVTTRTIRYYVSEGLLPAPGREGRTATYQAEHLARLHLIKLLKDEFLPLQEIRTLLSGLDHQAVLELLAEKRQLDAPPDTAKAYLQTLLNPSTPSAAPQPLLRHRLRQKQVDLSKPSAAPEPDTPFEVGSANVVPDAPVTVAPTQWRRIQLTPEIELHIRIDVSKKQDPQKIEQLINFSKHLFA